MTLFDDANFIFLQCKLKKCNHVIAHELRCDCAASHTRELFFYKTNILRNLDDTNLIFSTLGLYWNDVVTASLVNPDIKLIYFNLPNTLYGCAQMVLETVSGKSQEGVD